MTFLIGLVYVAQGQKPPADKQLTLELTVWNFSLRDIPTQHLRACFERALGNKRDDYMMRASAVMREWDLYAEELRTKHEDNNRRRLLGLRIGERITFTAWKEQHAHQYPQGCERTHCVICYPSSGVVAAWPKPGAEAFTREMWQRMARPTPEEDAAIRAALATKEPEPQEEEDDNDLPF